MEKIMIIRDSLRNRLKLLKLTLSSFSSFLLDYILFAAFAGILPTAAANIFARMFSAAYNYAVNCRVVFRREENPKTAAQYFSLALFILAANSVLLQIFLWLHIPVYLAKILTEAALFLISWTVQKKLIFARSGSRNLVFEKRAKGYGRTAGLWKV